MTLTRNQFIEVLNLTYYSQVVPIANQQDFNFAVFLNDKTSLYAYITNYLRAQGRITYYLAAWDACTTDPQRDAVYALIDGLLGSAVVDAPGAIKWPPTNGLFGDVKGPGTIADLTPAGFNGTSGQLIAENNLVNISKAVAVNGKVVGNTFMFTTRSDKRFVTIGVYVTLITVSGLAIVCTTSVGTNASSYNNICAATLLTGLTGANQILQLPLLGNLNSIAASSDVYVRVSIGSTATVYDLNVSLTGFYI